MPQKTIPKKQPAPVAPKAPRTDLDPETAFRTQYGLIESDVKKVIALADATAALKAAIVSRDAALVRKHYAQIATVNPRDVERVLHIARRLLDPPLPLE